MAKKPAEKPKEVEQKSQTAEPVAFSYRIDKVDAFNWQSIRTVLYSDGVFAEEFAFKADVFEIVTRKLFILMRDEAKKRFEVVKAERLAKEAEANA